MFQDNAAVNAVVANLVRYLKRQHGREQHEHDAREVQIPQHLQNHAAVTHRNTDKVTLYSWPFREDQKNQNKNDDCDTTNLAHLEQITEIPYSMI